MARKKYTMGNNKIQQFHLNPKSAKEQINKSIREPFGTLSKDFQGMHVARVRIVKKQPHPDNPARPDKTARKLYNIYLEKDKR